MVSKRLFIIFVFASLAKACPSSSEGNIHMYVVHNYYVLPNKQKILLPPIPSASSKFFDYAQIYLTVFNAF